MIYKLIWKQYFCKRVSKVANSTADTPFSFFYSHGSIKFCTYQDIWPCKPGCLRSTIDTSHYSQLSWCSIISYHDRYEIKQSEVHIVSEVHDMPVVSFLYLLLKLPWWNCFPMTWFHSLQELAYKFIHKCYIAFL